MEGAAEMGSGVMIYIPSFVKTGSAVQKLIQHRDGTSLISLKKKIQAYTICTGYPVFSVGCLITLSVSAFTASHGRVTDRGGAGKYLEGNRRALFHHLC
jgi:hypothetical protein